MTSFGFAQITATAAGLLLTSLPPAAQAQTASDETGNKAIVQCAFDAWASGTGSPYDLLAEDASWTITGTHWLQRTIRAVKPLSRRSSGRSMLA